jgi:lysophospholipid acyltransferase (LPLAT)-like uncharacterized protein
MTLYKNIALFFGFKERGPGWTRLAARVVSAAAWALARSFRLVELGAERHQMLLGLHAPLIYAFWHGHQLPLLAQHGRRRDLDVLVSLSGDGQLLFEVLRRWGLSAVRGSSSRGGADALEELLQRLGAGRSVALTPDGPRGPRHSVAQGVVALARWSGRPIVPVAAAASPASELRSWDRFLVPWPAARVAIGYGAPVWVPRDGAPAEYCATLAQRLDDLAAELVQAVRP